jgi:hypothetical protein
MSLRTIVMSVVAVLAAVALFLFFGSVRAGSNPEPRRLATRTVIPAQSSSISVPITARVADLERLLNDSIPMTFTSTEAQQAACASGGLAGRIGCQFTGTVTRGPITVSGGDADTLRLSIPVSGTVNATEMARFVGTAPVSAAAVIDATVRIAIVGDWHPDAQVAISYRWLTPPGFDVFGRRISAAAVADPIIAGLITRLEAAVPECIEKLQPRERLAAAWAQGFTVVPVNPQAPAVWLRITPQKLHFANYSLADGVLTLGLGATALTETFIGTQPAAPLATALPPPAPIPAEGLSAFRAHVPIVADYAGLEALVATTLKQVETPPMNLRGVGPVAAQFDAVEIHATDGGRLAIGLTLSAATERQWLRPSGTVWLTALPYNAPGSQRLEVRDVRVTGSPDTASFRLLLSVAQSRLVRDQIGRALTQDFTRQTEAALATTSAALADKRLGDFILSVMLDSVTNGTLVAGAEGLYLPVDAVGTARLRLDPVPR